MKKIFITSALLAITFFCFGQKPGIGKFHSAEKFDKVFYATQQAATTLKFAIKTSDKENGVIQAEMHIIGGGGKVINLFAQLKQDENNGKTTIQVTLNKPFGVTGNMSKMAKSLGEEIKKTISDLVIE